MKRIVMSVASLLLIAIVLSLFPVVHCGAVALEEDTVTQEIVWQSNPRYKGCSHNALSEATMQPRMDTSVYASTTFTSEEDAVKQIRKYLKERNTSFTIKLETKYGSSDKIIERMMEAALEHTGDPEEGDYLAWQFAGWSAETETNWRPTGYTHKYTIEVSYYTTKKQEAAVDAEVEKILEELNVDGKSDYKKICAVYDYLCENVTYDYDNLEDDSYTLKHTAYAAIVDKTAVCQGYAVAMYRLLLELGVDNRVIVGISQGENHAWNIVGLDGLYYNVDATWDAQTSEYKYFLRSTKNFVGHTRYLDYETFDFHDAHPMAAKDYKSGEKASKDKIIREGSCGESTKWVLTRDRTLTISGKGAIKDYPYSGPLEHLAPWVFWEADIEEIVVKEGVTILGDYIFCDMTSLTSVSLPSTLTEIHESVFVYDTALKEIQLPDSLITIDSCVFRECTALESVTIPDSVTSMGVSMFADCTNLKSVKIGAGMKELPDQTFRDCTSLTSVKLPSKLKTMGERVFWNCTALTSVTIPKSVQSMGVGVFSGCTNLEKVTFKGTTYLDNSTFDYCEALEKIYFKSDAPEFHDLAFSDLVATCYYPADNSTWTKDIMKDYGGTITWAAELCGDGHTEVTDAGKKATCTEDGLTEGKHCSVCGKVIEKQKKIEAKGHSFGEWEIVKEPTTEKEGRAERKCSDCGEVEKKTLDKLPPEETEPVVTYEEVDETVYATQSVNVRSEANSSSKKLGQLEAGVAVKRTGIGDNGWSRIEYDGKVAYVYSEYLTTTVPETEPVETEPVETEPEETQPPQTEPAETQPPETEPAQTQPVETEPAQTESATAPSTEVETQPPQTGPAQTETTQTQPSTTAPAEGEEEPDNGVPWGVIAAVVVVVLGGAAAAVILIKKHKK